MSKTLIRIWTILSVAIFIGANLSVLLPSFFLWQGNVFFLFEKYAQAEDAFRLLSNYNKLLPADKNRALFNGANTSYKKQNYAQAISQYNALSGSTDELGFLVNHNLGNAWYRFGQKQVTDEGKIRSWSFALESYDKALKIEKNTQTKANRDFVAGQLKELLEQIQKQQQQQQQQNKQNNSWKSGSGQTSASGSQSSSGSQDTSQSGSGSQMKKDGQTWKNTGQFNNIGYASGSSSPISQEQREQLEAYIQYLQQLQKDKDGYLRSPNESGVSLFEQFFGNDPFFSQIENSSPQNQNPDW